MGQIDDRPPDHHLLRIACAAFAASAVIFLADLAVLASPRHELTLHLRLPAAAIFVPVLIYFFVTALVLFLLLVAVRNTRWPRRVLWSALIAGLPWIALKNIFILSEHLFDRRLSHLCFYVLLLGGVLLVFALPQRIFEAIRRGFQTLLVVLAAPALLLVCEGCVFAALAIHGDRLADLAPPPPTRIAPQRASHRVIWIVLDELAEKQALELRLPSLPLPEFDRWKQFATLFTDVQPTALFTEEALPSLLTGVSVKDIRGTADGQGMRTRDAAGHWSPFNPANTVFGDAVSLDFHPAIVGWFLPYCKLFRSIVPDCAWVGESVLGTAMTTSSIRSNLAAPVRTFFARVRNFLFGTYSRKFEQPSDSIHLHDFLTDRAAADRLLADPTDGFILLHMPIPHPQGIYDRRAHSFIPSQSSYVDNLALADEWLAHMRQLLQSTGQWDDATILVMGDHSWRARLLWRGTTQWSADDEAALGDGAFDPRPAYMLKLPGQTQPVRIDQPFDAIHTRALLDALLRRQIADPAALRAWVETLPHP